METTTRPAVVLADSLTLPGAVSIGRPDHRGKVHASDLFTREELQAIVQQAHDVYGIVADPFATPGSAEAPAGQPCERCANHDPRDRRDHGHLPRSLTRGTARAFA